LVPPHDPAALAERIAAALDAPEGYRRLRAEARARVVETLDARRVIYPRKLAWLEAAAGGGRAARPAPGRRR
jgi:glycosyltransferase involved in cell wall biosynthesis